MRRFILKSLGVLCAVVVSFAFGFIPADKALAASYSEIEPNNTLAAATEIFLNTDTYGVISDSSDEDWYKFTITSPGVVTVNFKHDTTDAEYISWYIDLYSYNSANGQTRELSSFRSNENSLNMNSGDIGLPAGTYYIDVDYGNGVSNINYTVAAKYTQSSKWEREFNDNLQTANGITINTDYSGTLSDSSDDDWYKFSIPSAGFVVVNLKHGSTDQEYISWYVYLYKYNPSNGDVDELTSFRANENSLNMKSGCIGLPAGTYYIKVDFGSGVTNIDYSIAARYTQSSSWEREFNDTLQTANAISINSGCWGTLPDSSDEDWYKFILSSARTITLKFTHRATEESYDSWYVYLYKYNPSNGNVTTVTSFYPNGASLSRSSDAVSLAAGTYYIKVDYGSSVLNINYSVRAITAPAAPAGPKAQSASYSSIKVSWNAVSGATGYSIYRATSLNGTYMLIKKTALTSYVITGLVTGTTYYYKVRAYLVSDTTTMYGAASAIVSAKPQLSTPTAHAARVSSTSVKVNWSAVPGATKYQIYRYNSQTGTYSLVTTTASTAYINGNLVTGVTYYYKVRAYRLVGSSIVYGSFSSVASARP